MKKLFATLGAVLATAACANNNYDCGETYVEEPCPCQEQAPVQAYQPRYEYQPAQVAYVQQPAAPCQGEFRTMREPVEVVYKRTTYGQPVVIQENAAVAEHEYIVPAAQPAPAPAPQQAPAKKYNGPVVIVPAQ